MRRALNSHKSVETLFKQIQVCVDYVEARGVTICHAQKISVDYAQIFVIGSFMSACRRLNEKEVADKTWTNFKIHFVVAHHQHMPMQGESAASSRYHADNAAGGGGNQDQMVEATIGAI
jgi:hypothetical protein